jgi:hypothetical protein
MESALDHLIARENGFRNPQSERLCGLEIDRRREFAWLLANKTGRLDTLQNPDDVSGGAYQDLRRNAQRTSRLASRNRQAAAPAVKDRERSCSFT